MLYCSVHTHNRLFSGQNFFHAKILYRPVFKY